MLDRVLDQYRYAVASAIAVIGATACGPAQAGTTAFSCSVIGKQHIGSTEAICLPFRQKIDATLPQALTTADTFLTGSGQDTIKVEIRILKHGSMIVQVIQRKQGKLYIHPDQAIDVMDRPIRLKDVERLADEVAKLVGKA